jgi:hypothetical protein
LLFGSSPLMGLFFASDGNLYFIGMVTR